MKYFYNIKCFIIFVLLIAAPMDPAGMQGLLKQPWEPLFGLEVEILPKKIRQGEMGLLKLSFARPVTELKLVLREHYKKSKKGRPSITKLELFPFQLAQDKVYYSFYPLSLSWEIKKRFIKISYKFIGRAQKYQAVRPLTWRWKQYHHQEIRMPKRKKSKVFPTTKKQKKKVYKDHILYRRVFSNPTPQKLWQGQFIFPITPSARNRKTDGRFGYSRTFWAGKKKRWSIHTGYDISAKKFAPVQASNKGKVRIAKRLHYGGNTVALDHGGGLFTVYCHLSVMNVKEEEIVPKGHVIGLVGATGRATGPHLHWAVRYYDITINPKTLVQLTKELEQYTKKIKAKQNQAFKHLGPWPEFSKIKEIL
jgi:hypothetical protein